MGQAAERAVSTADGHEQRNCSNSMYFSLLGLPDFLYLCMSLGKRDVSFQLHNFFPLSVLSILGLKIHQNVLDTFPIEKINSFSLYLAHLGVLDACFYLKT